MSELFCIHVLIGGVAKIVGKILQPDMQVADGQAISVAI